MYRTARGVMEGRILHEIVKFRTKPITNQAESFIIFYFKPLLPSRDWLESAELFVRGYRGCIILYVCQKNERNWS